MRWLIEREEEVGTIDVDFTLIASLEKMAAVSVAFRADRLLRYLAANSEYMGQGVLGGTLEQIRATYSFGKDEVAELANYLQQLGWLTSTINIDYQRFLYVTPQGYLQLESGQTSDFDSDQGFVAMWFHPSMTDVYLEGFESAIESCGYLPFRVDRKEHTNKIDDEIISEIRKSRFLVADFTGHRGGVYFEAGFAQGIGLPVIWTCRKADMQGLHFDIRQYNCIDWESVSDLKDRLSKRIVARVGMGRRGAKI